VCSSRCACACALAVRMSRDPPDPSRSGRARNSPRQKLKLCYCISMRLFRCVPTAFPAYRGWVVSAPRGGHRITVAVAGRHVIMP
jgi:hypothetical protein